MCEDDLPRIENLPRRSTTDVRTNFADLVREVRKAGVVAITNRGKIEVVMVSVDEYRRRTTPFTAVANDPRAQASLAELTAEFDRRLAALQDPDVGKRVDAMMNTRGKTKCRPKAGDF